MRHVAGSETLWPLALLLVVGTGCGGGEPKGGTLGELGEGYFSYHCVDDADDVCNESDEVNTAEVDVDLGINAQIPGAVAVGARWDLTYFGDVYVDGDLLFVETVPARPDVVSNLGGFVVKESGEYAFLARGKDGVVADFVHITALEPAGLDVWRDEQRINAFEMNELTEVFLAVVPTSKDDFSLAGSLDYEWTSSDPAVVLIDDYDNKGTGEPDTGTELNDDEVRVWAVGPGTATITVSHDGVAKSVAVTVAAATEEGQP